MHSFCNLRYSVKYGWLQGLMFLCNIYSLLRTENVGVAWHICAMYAAVSASDFSIEEIDVFFMCSMVCLMSWVM